MERLGYDFFHRPCLVVAEELVGKLLVHNGVSLRIVKGWYMSQGNLTYASMLTTIRDMMGFRKITEMTAMGEVSPKQIAQLNRLLSRVKK